MYITIKEASDISMLTRQRIHQLANTGRINSTYISPVCRMVSRKDLESHMLKNIRPGLVGTWRGRVVAIISSIHSSANVCIDIDGERVEIPCHEITDIHMETR